MRRATAGWHRQRKGVARRAHSQRPRTPITSVWCLPTPLEEFSPTCEKTPGTNHTVVVNSHAPLRRITTEATQMLLCFHLPLVGRGKVGTC
jgi:hypothetical protein